MDEMAGEVFMYDYIIIGAGSAGCVLANRLSANPSTRVLLLEAGPADRNIFLKIPAGVSQLYVNPALNWGYFTEPEPNLNGRRLYWPRGKTLGGSSAINGMIYVRGQPVDYDTWSRLGNPGWSWQDVLPLFKRIEHNERGADAWHGDSGELYVTDARYRHPTSEAFIKAAQACGTPPSADFNGISQLGVGFYQFTIRGGVRHSSATAFLAPALKRPNLRIETGACAERIVFEGSRAVGVVYHCRGEARRVEAREIVLSGGAINSPQLLMLSGVGKAEHLRDHDIGVVCDLPGVGGNLQDHLYIHHIVETEPKHSINRAMRGWRLFPAAMRYLLLRDGLFTIAASQAAAFVKSAAQIPTPDLQIMFKPYTLEISPHESIVPAEAPGLTTAVTPLRPLSRGILRLKTPNFRDAPAIFPNYLAEAADRDAMIAGLRLIRRIFAAPPLSHMATENKPGAAMDSDEALLRFVRAEAQSMFHPVGTCKMGDDPAAVVDSRLRVRGLTGLRVADASIMPTIVSGNTNAASIMIGEKAASMLLEDATKTSTN
jgi:choline dehydrogenase